MSQEYDSYYGDGDNTELLRDGTGQRRDHTKRINVTENLESKVSELESKNNGLEWKIKAMALSVTALLICSLGILIFCIVQQLNIENLSDTGTQHADQVGCIILHTIIFINFFMKSIKRLIWKYSSFKK